MKIFGKVFSFNKSKREPFLENLGHTFLDIDKNFTKAKFHANLIAIKDV